MAKKKAQARAKTTRAGAGKAKAKGGIEVTLRTQKGAVASTIPCGPDLQSAAYRWTYVLRSRTRWRKESSARKDLAEQGRADLISLGLAPADLEQLAASRWIEVSLPYESEEIAWEARILPWEYLLSVATRSAGRRHRLTVVRHLDRKGPAPKFSDPPKVAVVTSAPGEIGQQFDFTQERVLPGRELGFSPEGTGDGTQDPSELLFDNPNLSLLENPTAGELNAFVRDHEPEILHVGGVDSYQAFDQLNIDPASDGPSDGMILSRTEDGARIPVPVGAPEVAKAVRGAGRKRPALVVYNLYRSAARTAALTVGEGAGYALGFQDTFDDELAEIFLADFYRSLRESEFDVHLAFATAWRLLKESGRDLRGSGIVLWSSKSMLDGPTDGEDRRSLDLAHRIRQKEREVLHADTEARARELIQVRVSPKSRINYSLLHNRRPFFEQFELRRAPGRVDDVEVEVALHVGSERPVYRSVVSLDTAVKSLEKDIFLPLTWMKDGGFWESVRSSLFVRVSWQGHDLYEQSHPVTLLPVDQWTDTDENRQSLPSFVYPRDPAVSKVIRAAQEVLIGLADDPAQGFDGYQSVDPEAEDPNEGVDRQVQAIWQALVHDITLSYINPPPSFEEASQRLRTPSEVVEGARGTCIDLTLLLASCCEYVEIYPVIFLLQGHAFPGYWRSEQAHHDFMIPSVDGTDASPTVWQRSPWLVEGEAAFHEIVAQVHEGNLVPLESVWLTQRAAFWEAIEEGWENLRVAGEFHSLIDVTTARRYDVTPLPIRGMRS